MTGLPNDRSEAPRQAGAADAPISMPRLPLPSESASSRPRTIRSTRSFAKLRILLDSRLLSLVVLVLLSFAVIARESFIAFLIAIVVGYMLTDRFDDRSAAAVTLGGSAWFSVIFFGSLLTARARPLFVDIDYLFMFCGFLLACAVCGVFFVGRALYYAGYDRGQAAADRVIAGHLVDGLIDNPQDVDNLDGTFLEVEGAISRVRDQERQVAEALRDEARRKDDLVTYLAHDLKTPLASVVGYLSLLQEAPDLPVEQRSRFTGIALDKAHRLDALIEEFFDITRFDFHDIVLTRGYVDLSLLLAQVADEFYPPSPSRASTSRSTRR